MGLGKAVVYPDFGVFGDLPDDVGFKFARGDVEDLRTQLQEIVACDAISSYGMRGKAFVEQFRPEEISRRTSELYFKGH